MFDSLALASIRARQEVGRARDAVLERLAPEGDPEEGSTTVEYAIGAVAAAGFAGLLLVILKSGAVKGLLQGIIESALSL